MNYWNLLVVLCFAVLYLGLSVVFTRLRRLQNELKTYHQQFQAQALDTGVIASACAETMGQKLTHLEDKIAAQIQTLGTEWMGPRLAATEERVGVQIQTMGELLRSDLQAIQGEMRFVSRKEDTYREARLLLSYGVDEERVVAETGQTMEEISLLKRVTGVKQRFGQGRGQPPAVTHAGAPWDYAPVGHLNAGGDGLARLALPASTDRPFSMDGGDNRLPADRLGRFPAERDDRFPMGRDSRYPVGGEGRFPLDRPNRFPEDHTTRLASDPGARFASDQEARLASDQEAPLASDQETRFASNYGIHLASDQEVHLASEPGTLLASDRELHLASDPEARSSEQRDEEGPSRLIRSEDAPPHVTARGRQKRQRNGRGRHGKNKNIQKNQLHHAKTAPKTPEIPPVRAPGRSA